MHGSLPQSTTLAPDNGDRSVRTADRAYQTLTIAAILLVLGSLWLF
jgi:hypothetical protein